MDGDRHRSLRSRMAAGVCGLQTFLLGILLNISHSILARKTRISKEP